MKQIKPPTITLEMTQREAKIIQCVFAMLLEDDPYGKASNNLGININEIVNTGRDFESILGEAIDKS